MNQLQFAREALDALSRAVENVDQRCASRADARLLVAQTLVREAIEEIGGARSGEHCQ